MAAVLERTLIGFIEKTQSQYDKVVVECARKLQWTEEKEKCEKRYPSLRTMPKFLVGETEVKAFLLGKTATLLEKKALAPDYLYAGMRLLHYAREEASHETPPRNPSKKAVLSALSFFDAACRLCIEPAQVACAKGLLAFCLKRYSSKDFNKRAFKLYVDSAKGGSTWGSQHGLDWFRGESEKNKKGSLEYHRQSSHWDAIRSFFNFQDNLALLDAYAGSPFVFRDMQITRRGYLEPCVPFSSPSTSTSSSSSSKTGIHTLSSSSSSALPSSPSAPQNPLQSFLSGLSPPAVPPSALNPLEFLSSQGHSLLSATTSPSPIAGAADRRKAAIDRMAARALSKSSSPSSSSPLPSSSSSSPASSVPHQPEGATTGILSLEPPAKRHKQKVETIDLTQSD